MASLFPLPLPAPATPCARCMVLTCSDSRTLQTDRSGAYLAEVLGAAGHRLMDRQVVADDIAAIRARVLEAVESEAVDVLVISGGTGVAPSDVTPDAVVPLFSKRLPGFGESFRQLAVAALGPEAWLSRADAGIIARTLVFIVPGAPPACQLAMDRLILPILPHATSRLRRPTGI